MMAQSLSRLESSLDSLKGDVADAMRLAAKAAEAKAATAQPAAPAVTEAELDRIADRVAGVEERVEELASIDYKIQPLSRPSLKEGAAPPSDNDVGPRNLDGLVDVDGDRETTAHGRLDIRKKVGQYSRKDVE